MNKYLGNIEKIVQKYTFMFFVTAFLLKNKQKE